MRIADILLDSVTTEMSMQRQARQAANVVIQHVYHGHQPYQGIEIVDDDRSLSGDFYVYRSKEDLGLHLDFLLLIGVRQPNTVGMSGAVAGLGQDVFGYETAIAIYCMQQFGMDQLRRSVNSVGFMQTFEHEYLHLLDNQRTDNRIIGKDVDPKDDRAGYYNDPAEFNAYYHDIAKDMMAVIDAAAEKPEDAKDYFDLYGFTGDWKSDLSHLLMKNVYTQSFVKHLTPERRKALLRRLYRLYQTLLETLADQRPANSPDRLRPAPGSLAHSATAA